VTLTLIDSLRAPLTDGVATLHGESLDGRLTLLGAFTIRRNDWHGSAEHNRERLHVGTVLIGTQVMAPEDLVFVRALATSSSRSVDRPVAHSMEAVRASAPITNTSCTRLP